MESSTSPSAVTISAKLSSCSINGFASASESLPPASLVSAATSVARERSAVSSDSVELGVEAQIEEEADGDQHHRHHRGEDQGHPDPDRDPPHGSRNR